MKRGYVDTGRVHVGAFVEPALKRDLVEIAYQQSVTVSEVIRDALRQHATLAQESASA